MRRNGAWLVVALLLLAPARSEVIVETDIEHGAEIDVDAGAESRDPFIVVLFPPQTRVYEHFYLEQRRKQPQRPLLQTTTRDIAADHDFGFYGDQALPLVGPAFDIAADIHELVDDMDSGADWSILEVSVTPFFDSGRSSDMRRIQATDVLKESDARGAIYIEFMALISPEYDRLRVIARVAAFEKRRRGQAREILETRYEYFSPSRGTVLDDALHPEIALARAWPPELMEAAIRLGIERLRPFIAADIREFDPHRPNRKDLVRFDYYNSWWALGWRRGAIVARKEGRTVYRDKYGNVYSMPDD